MESWLPTLITETPEAGHELALHLSRLAVKFTQPEAEIRKKLRLTYAENADSLTMVSDVVTVHFQTVAVANNRWRKRRLNLGQTINKAFIMYYRACVSRLGPNRTCHHDLGPMTRKAKAS
jgi:Hexameric tyrosine-coordinated heme protein (HTHP)